METSITYRFYDLDTGNYFCRGYKKYNTDLSFEFDYLNRDTMEIPFDYIDRVDVKGKIVVVHIARKIAFVGVCLSNYDTNVIKATDFLTFLDTNFVVSDFVTKETSVEELIYNIINSKYLVNSDTIANINTLTLKKSTDTIGTFYSESNTELLSDLIKSAFKKYNIILKTTFNIKTKKVEVEIFQKEKTFLNIWENSQVEDLEYDSFSMQTNKLILYSAENNAYLNTYYLLADSTITEDATATGRITPIKEEYSFVSADSDSGEYDTLSVAEEKLTPIIYNSDIKFKLLSTSKIYDIENITIGQYINFKTQNFGILQSVISSISYEANDLYIIIKCGTNNITLTNVINKLIRKAG